MRLNFDRSLNSVFLSFHSFLSRTYFLHFLFDIYIGSNWPPPPPVENVRIPQFFHIEYRIYWEVRVVIIKIKTENSRTNCFERRLFEVAVKNQTNQHNELKWLWIVQLERMFEEVSADMFVEETAMSSKLTAVSAALIAFSVNWNITLIEYGTTIAICALKMERENGISKVENMSMF